MLLGAVANFGPDITGSDISSDISNIKEVGFYNGVDEVSRNTDNIDDIGFDSREIHLALSAQPGWNVDYPTETTVLCIASIEPGNGNTTPFQTPNLFRDGQSVSNPDVGIFNVGDYNYFCTYLEADPVSNTLIINKGESIVNLLLNDVDGDIIVDINEQVEMKGILIVPAPQPEPQEENSSVVDQQPGNVTNVSKIGLYSISLYLDGQLIKEGNRTVVETVSFNEYGLHNITIRYLGSENYSASEETHQINVRYTPTLALFADPSWNVNYGTETTILCQASVEPGQGNNTPDQIDLYLYKDNILVNNPNIDTLPVGIYNYSCNSTEEGVIGIYNILTISKEQSEVNLLLNGIDGDIIVDIDDPVIMSGTLIIPQCPPMDQQPGNATNVSKNPYHIKLYLDNQLINQGDCSLENTTSFSEYGIHNVTVIHEGSENYTSSYETHWITIAQDIEPPVVTILSPLNISYFTNAILVNIIASDNVAVDQIWFSVDGGTNVTYSSSFIGLFALGPHILEAWANDTSNNLGYDFVIFEINVDNPPVVTLLNPPNASTDIDGDVTVEFMVTDDWSSTLDCNYWSNTSGSWVIDATRTVANGTSDTYDYLGLADGAYEWNVECIDDSMNNAFAPENWIFFVNTTIPDIEPPVVILLNPPNASIDNDGDVTIEYTVTDNADLFLDCNIWSNTSGTWSIDGSQVVSNGTTSPFDYLGLLNGAYEWNVECIDDSSNSAFAPENWIFIVDVPVYGVDIWANVYYQETFPSVDAAYTIYVNNTGSIVNTFDLTVQNLNGADTAYVNIIQLTLMPGEVGTSTLYVGDATVGIYDVTVTAIDSSNPGVFDITNIIITNVTAVPDTIAPWYINEQVNPPSPTNYNTGPYIFSIEWLDNVAVTNVVFEFDGTNYTPVCIPVLPSADSICSYTFIDLAAGTYDYKWYASDSANNWNSTSLLNYVVNKIDHTIHLSLDGIEADLIVNYPATTTSTGWLEIIQAETNAVLYRDGIIVANGNPATEIAQLPVGIYNYTYYYPESQNYTEQTITRWLTIQKATSTCTLSFNPLSPIIYTDQPFIAQCSCTNPEESAKMYRDNFDFTTEIGMPITLAANPTGYNYVCNVSETQNYTGASDSDIYIINKADHTIHLALDGIEADLIVQYPITTNATGWLEITQSLGNALLYRNNQLIAIGSPASDITQLPAGIYNYTYYYSESQNYTEQTITRWLTVNQAITTLTLNAQPSWNEYVGTETNITCQANTNEVLVNLYRDDVLVASGYNIIFETNTLPAGSYVYVCNTSGNQNWTAASVTNTLIINPLLAGEVHLYLNGIEDNLTITYETQSNATSTTPYGYVTLYRDGIVVANGTSPQSEIATFAAGVYNYTAVSSGDITHDSASITYFLTINKAPPSLTLLLDSLDADLIIIEGDTVNQTGILNIPTEGNLILYRNGFIFASGPTPLTQITTYNSPNVYNITVYYAGNENYTEGSAMHWLTVLEANHDIGVDDIVLLKEVNNINVTVSSSTAYWNDLIFVKANISNVGNKNETNIEIALEDNSIQVDSQFINLNIGETKEITFIYTATTDNWHTIKVKALPIVGETNLVNNEQSEAIEVWQICNVIDCSIFRPITNQSSYVLGENFITRAPLSNLWATKAFYDIKVKLDVSSGLTILSTWPQTQYIDLPAGGFDIAYWNVTSTTTGTKTLTAWAGNTEYSDNKQIQII